MLDALAIYRLTRLAIDDVVIEDLRNEIIGRIKSDKLAYGLSCYWCLSFWVALVCTPIVRTRAWQIIRWPLAMSAAVGLISQVTDE